MANVRLNNLSKVYSPGTKEHFHAVKGIDLEVKDKEFMVLVGPSGCGKSTTLRMIAGLEEASEGDLFIGDVRINDVLPKDRDIAMVFQNYALYPHMSVSDNMAFGLKLRKIPKSEITKRVDEAADILGLRELLGRRPKALSGGQRQRVALGRAIVRKPSVFLFDEPLSNLDAKMRVQMRAEISKLHERLDATMIYVTHDQTEAMTMGDRICVMNDGEIKQVNRPIDIYESPADIFTAGFVGLPQMNFLNGRVVASTGSSGLDFISTSDHPIVISLEKNEEQAARLNEGMEVVLGVRPEHFILCGKEDEGAVEAVVEVREPLGAESFIYLRLPSGESLVIRLKGMINLEVGHSLFIKPDLNEIHLFNASTKERV